MDSIDLAQWGYIGACIVVPALWGAVSAWLFTRSDKKTAERDQQPPVDYAI